MKFYCMNPDAIYACDQIWEGRVLKVIKNKDTLEADIEGKGSAMHVIVGKYQNGQYLCMPGWGVGSELTSLDDSFWNQEQLERYLSKADAITITEALKTISQELRDMA